ncbi:2OG-FeII Oxy [Acrasis kona]|uniref:2OG-FeII Oxy n=1 Tax=Acrasis kona TaxID=1008807 RepID=A0AAW2YXM6_9EUKA
MELQRDALTIVMQYLSSSPETLCSFSSTCKANYSLLESKTVWMLICTTEWQFSPEERRQAVNVGWHQTYIDRKRIEHLWNNSAEVRKNVLSEYHSTSVFNLCLANIRIGNNDKLVVPTLFSAEKNGSIVQWDLSTRLHMKYYNNLHHNKITRLQYLGDNIIASCDEGGHNGSGSTINIFDAASGELFYTVPDINEYEDECIGKTTFLECIRTDYLIHVSGSYIFIRRRDKKSKASNPYQILHVIQTDDFHQGDITNLQILNGLKGQNDVANDGVVKYKELILTTSSGGVMVHEMLTGKCISKALCSTSCSFTLSDGHVVCGQHDGSISILDACRDLECVIYIHQAHSKGVSCIHAYRDDKNMLHVASGSLDSHVIVHRIKEKNNLQRTSLSAPSR